MLASYYVEKQNLLPPMEVRRLKKMASLLYVPSFRLMGNSVCDLIRSYKLSYYKLLM